MEIAPQIIPENDSTSLSRSDLESLFNEQEIERFVDALGLDRSNLTFQRFPTKNQSSGWAEARTGSLDELMPWIKNSNLDQRATVSIMLNPCTGPKQADVTWVQVVFVDDDTPRDSYRTDWPLEPHMITETSPGKFHYFWLFEPGYITPKELGKLQGRIAAQYGTDTSLSDFSKKARLAGTVHLKGPPFTTRIVKVNKHPRYTREQLIEAFGDFTNAPAKPRAKLSVTTDGKLIHEVGRNDTLFRWVACAARQRGAGPEEIMALLLETNHRNDPPLSTEELNAIRNQAEKYPAGSTHYPLTDAGNSERYAAAAHGKLCHDYTTKTFMTYHGGIWQSDAMGAAERLAVEVARDILREAADIEDENVRNAMIRWAKKSESLKVRKAMIEGARYLLAVDNSLFDADPLMLNLQNGCLNLESGEFLPHQPDQYCTKQAGCSYDPGAHAPRWSTFINEFTCNDPELADCLQKLFGRCLTGDVSEQTINLFYGSGANGKSVLMEVITSLLGSYAVSLRPDFLLDSSKNHELEALELRGARLAICHELPENGRLAENRVKSLTGGDPVKARGLYQNFQVFNPTAKFILLSNHRPYITSGSHAIWRRLRLVPCDYRAEPGTADPKLADKLAAELPGILNWALAGLRKWQQEGEVLPERMKQELQEYQEAEDSLGIFLSETCNYHNTFSVDKSELYRLYRAWATDAGEFVLSHKALTKKLSERGIKERRTAQARQYIGIGLKPSILKAA
jgi:putative DNA primase/helicase